MQRRLATLHLPWPAAAAVALGAAVGLTVAAAAAAPLAAAWSAYVLPAFGSLLGTLYIC